MTAQRTLVAVPNDRARALGLPEEIRVGWRPQGSFRVLWFGSCKNRATLDALIEDARAEFGEFAVETDQL